MNETICAIATGFNNAGVGIVRISGDKCLEIAEKILKKTPTPRYAHYGDFYHNDEIIDEGVAIYFKSPNSFTGEDILELQGHGGVAVMQNILDAVLDSGAIIAESGEFSKRAFLNGKMDLVQAEAIADMIQAQSSKAAKLAINSLKGEFSKKINELRTKIIELRVFVEATIDFVDEEIDFISDNKVFDKIKDIIAKINTILNLSKQGSVLREGINIAIIGKPNAGKSSLLNALTLEESAIVTSIAGTTRDIIKEQIIINGVQINLIDTAGIRDSIDEVESIGIMRAKNESKKADIVLLVFESGTSPDMSLLQNNDTYILVQNKIDLNDESFDGANLISAKNNIGIDDLKNKILKMAGVDDLNEGVNLARKRHIFELENSLFFMQNAANNLTGESIELVADDLNTASNHLGKITGIFSNDDLLGEIFSNFCVGK